MNSSGPLSPSSNQIPKAKIVHGIPNATESEHITIVYRMVDEWLNDLWISLKSEIPEHPPATYLLECLFASASTEQYYFCTISKLVPNSH